MCENNEMDMLSPPVLLRTLSSHHWGVAEIEMVQKELKIQSAGFADNWEYRVVRDSTKTRKARHETLRDGNVVDTKAVLLPKPQKCLGKNRDGHRCHRKVYWGYCKEHRPKVVFEPLKSY